MSIKSTCSKRMGELLLKGHIMAADTCMDCQIPLMRDPSTRVGLCVNCEATYREDGVRVGAPTNTSAGVDISSASAAPTDEGAAKEPVSLSEDQAGTSQPAAASAPADDEVSDAIAHKLVSGWALLDTLCPRCNTPLVRDRASRRMYCCSCDVWVLTEQQAADQPAPSNAAPPTPAGQGPIAIISSPTAATAAALTRQLPPPGDVGTTASHGSHAADGRPHATHGPFIKREPEEDGAPPGLVHAGAAAAGVVGLGGAGGRAGARGPRVAHGSHAAAVLAGLEEAVLERVVEITHMIGHTSLQDGSVGAADGLERLLRLAGGCVGLLKTTAELQGH